MQMCFAGCSKDARRTDRLPPQEIAPTQPVPVPAVRLFIDPQPEDITDRLPKVSRALPEDLVARILAMVPFPYIFKARALSKLWLARFSSVSAQTDEEKKPLAISFQKQVGEWSTAWKTFSPVFIASHSFISFDRVSHTWLRMPLLSFLPENILIRSNVQIEGALLFVSTWPENINIPYEYHAEYVANLLTRSWKYLPKRPPVGGLCLVKTLITYPSLDKYKVIVFHGDLGHQRRYLAEIYDSEADTWSSKRLVVSKHYNELSNPVYFSGVLYMIPDQNPSYLLAFNVEEGTWEELDMPPIDTRDRIPNHLMVCNDSLLMVTYHTCDTIGTMILWKIDPASRTLVEVAWGPPAGLISLHRFIPEPASDGHCIFFREYHEQEGAERYSGLLEYNVQEDEWSFFCIPESDSLTFSTQWNEQEDEWGFP